MKSNTPDIVRVTSKGQATIPSDLRAKYGIGAPGLVRFVDRGGRLVVEPVRPPSEMLGLFRREFAGRSPSDALHRERAEDAQRSRRRSR